MTITLTPAGVRAHIARASRMITPTWPLESFIAVNPVSGYEHLPFGDQTTTVPGITFTRTEQDYLHAHAMGEVSSDALRQAITRLIAEVVTSAPVTAGGRSVSGVDVALAALFTPGPDGEPSPSEAPSLSVADEIAARWLAVLLGSPSWPVRTGEGALYASFVRLASHDRSLPAAARRRLAALPHTPEETVITILADLAVTEDHLDSVLVALFAALPGWSSHVVWCAAHSSQITLTDYVALRLALHHALAQQLPSLPEPDTPAARDLRAEADRVGAACFGSARGRRAPLMRVLMFLDESTRLMIWQTATEIHYRTGLFQALTGAESTSTDPIAQLVFCIDARSEGIRRHLESEPAIETFGFAGFFATPLHHRSLFATAFREQYPALLSAGIATAETTPDGIQGERRRKGLFAENAAAASTKATSSSPVAAFMWAESAGWLTGIAATARTLAPTLSHRMASRLREAVSPQVPTRVDICDRLTIEEQTTLAEATLRMMGLTRFAPTVVITGHRSTTRNNLYQAALDCGACGGNGGAPNARAAAAIFNNPPVRAALRQRGLAVPDSTWFVAAEHDTATDTVTFLDPHLTPQTHRAAVNTLTATLAAAGDELTRERARTLPGATARTRLGRIRGRADDWAEMFPELGLAGNAAFLIGPRRISRGSDLHRRVFLHSYDAAADPDGTGLETIMTAPLIVGQWINHQYYFSTLNPHRFGAGNKTLHNPIHNLGVLAGQTGDLRVGLPWQSVAAGTRLLHTPLRLSVLIQAPLERIGSIVSATDALRNLLDNDWITLHARPDDTTAWRRYTRYGFTLDERSTP